MNTRVSFYKIIALLACVVYFAGFGFEYLLDPLGRSPVLDANENLAWASLIADGQLPEEPLYRALLYPWVLSLFPAQGAILAQLAALLGMLCHGCNALLVALFAKQLWRSRTAAWYAGVLYVLYPVALYFSMQVLDMTFAMTLFLLGLYCVVRGCESVAGERHRVRWIVCIIGGVLLGLSVLARPNFLLPLFCVPLAPFILCGAGQSQWRKACLPAVVLLVSMLLPLLGQGCYNFSKSGVFRVLPWQGAYNLLTANKTGANGKFYKQTVAFAEVAVGQNPNRMESEYLYRQVMGEDADLEIDAMNHYWRSQLVEDVADDPLRWIGLMGRKVFYLFNDWEQYNNLTYAYHKARFSFLQYNPLGWGVLLLGTLSMCGCFRALLNGRLLCFIAVVFALYAAGVLLFYVSARFRLPLTPLLAICCGGFAHLQVAQLSAFNAKQVLVALLVLGGASTLVYGSWFEARDRSSFIQDELLLASASALVGEDAQALRYASAVLARDPSRQDARRIQVSSAFNLWLLEADGRSKTVFWEELNAALEPLEDWDASTLFIAGVVAWRDGDLPTAKSTWNFAVQRYGAKQGSSSAEALRLVELPEGANERSLEAGSLPKLLFHP